MNICVRCQHHFQRNAGGNTSSWYTHFCRHPKVARLQVLDPVTGERCYQLRNDLGRTTTTSEQHPNCRDINQEGACELYEELP